MGLATQNIDFTYDKLSQLKKVDRSVTTNPGHLVTDYQYDGAGRLFDINNKFNSTVISNYNYAYDDGNRLSGKSGTDGISTVDYGKDNQISGVDNTTRPDEAYSFNALGIRAGWVTDALDKRRVLNDGTYQYQYDNEGNLTQKTEIATSKVTAYTWDYRNRLTSVTSGNQTVEYGYDAEDKRVSKKINGVVKEKYVYDGEDIALVVDAAGTLVERYLYGAGVDNVLSRVSAGTTIWSLGDRQGSVVDVVDEGGAVLNHFVYDSFGNRTTATGVDFRFGYTGRELDTETGLYYYRARYYDPSVGRFISEDPIGFGAGDTNLYRYVGNNSTNATAPTGLYSFDDFGRDAWNFGQGIGRNFDYSFDAINTHVFSPVGNAVVKPVVNAVNTNFITPFNNAASNAVGFYTDLVNEGQREGGVVGTFKQGAGIFGDTLASTPGAVGSFAQNNSTRIGGLFQAIGGAGEIYAGATTSATIFGAPVGALLAANGVDNFQAGLRKLFTGEDANTLLYDATKRLTGSDKLAGTVDAATGLVLNAAATGAAVKQAADRALAAEVKAINQGERAAEKAFLKTQCFIAGTEIQTINGTKNIEDIHVGDWVLSDDPNTVGEIEYKQVLNTFVKDTSSLVDIYIDGEKITTTEEHPFWVPDLGWVAAKDLHAGSLLQTKYESWLDVDRVELHGGLTTVYNFEVAGFHTYFVSDLGLLVHNTCVGNAARKKVMDDQKIPLSQQPISQSTNASGREFRYEVPKPGGGTQIKSVQQQTLDRSHPEQGHWEAGTVKTDPLTGEIRMNNYGRPKLTSDKSKVDYD